jgi:hypothetical protein
MSGKGREVKVDEHVSGEQKGKEGENKRAEEKRAIEGRDA